jgi:GT2 family glycosyltransferase
VNTLSDHDVSVILISWNSVELTSTAINTLRERTAGVTYEIIVVDNGSDRDGGAGELARRFPGILVIANPDNRGFAAANNQGLSVARGRYLLLLNSDTLQTENAIGKSVHYMDAHPDVGVLGIAHRNGDSALTHQPSTAAFPTPLRRALGLLWSFVPHSRYPNTTSDVPSEADVDWVVGSFFMIRRACLESVGPLDERFFVYGEDIDWCYQAWRAGWRVRFWPGVSLVHLGSSSASQVCDKTFMLYRNEMRFFRKNFSSASVLACYAAMSARLAASTLYQLFRWMAGRATRLDVRERWRRQRNFMWMESDRRGLSGP